MPYFDVSIPLKLKTLTYLYEEDKDLIGYAVEVPFRNRTSYGIVLNKREIPPADISEIKQITKILGRAYSEKFVSFLQWLSFYYLSEIGSVLRMTFFEEIVKLLKGKKTGKFLQTKPISSLIPSISLEQVKEETVSKIVEATRMKKYKTFLIHYPDISYEIALMFETVKRLSSEETILLIMPEIKDTMLLFSLIKEKIDENVALLHSDMKHSELLDSIDRIMQDKARIIVGTRSALFAPAKKLSLIMVAEESSWLYKEEQTPRYNARDCAVMRGFIENCPVVLTAEAPSVTSYFNSIRGKYELIDDFQIKKHPEIKIVRQPYKSIFHPETLFSLRQHYKEGVLITAPRSGYSLLRCAECGEIIRCRNCGYTMIFHKSLNSLECFRCNLMIKTPQECPYCLSTNVHSIGTGVEKIKEEVEKIFSKKNIKIKEFELEHEEFKGIYVIQTSRIKKGYVPVFKSAVIVDFDFFLSIPDYRALENAFLRILSIARLIKEDGILIIQTGYIGNEFLRFIQNYNFRDFYLYELKHREKAGFPPFVRLIKLRIKLKKTAKEETLQKVKELLNDQISGEVLGGQRDKDKNEFIFILRSKDKKELTEEAQNLLKKLKDLKGISFKVEVDPVSLRI